MNARIITGAGGFVGRRLVDHLHARGETVIGVGRGAAPPNWPAGVRWVRADLAKPEEYADALNGAACVIHLAAVTGKARPEEYERGNVAATRALLDASVKAGIARFIFVSSIAAKFTDRRFYPYAASKIAAEALVSRAAISSVIVRPTMILGRGSPIEENLAKLAGLPVAPMFGDGLRRVQPVDVDDVVDLLAGLARTPDIADTLIELGGPETFDLRTLYARLRAARGNQAPPRFLHLPLGFFRASLAFVEKPLLPVLPLTAGQLATFANDGIADPHPALARLLPDPRPSPRAAPGEIPAAPDKTDLTKEFGRHARHVADAAPTPYQTSKYIDFHARRGLAPRNPFDALLLKLSRLGGLGLALADSYSGLLYRASVIRSKLVLTLAILESSPPSFTALDAPDPGGAFAYVRMALRMAMAGFSLIAAAAFLAPAHLFFGLTGRLKPVR